MLSLPNTLGARPSNSAAMGICPDSNRRPFIAPRHEMTATTATASEAQSPNMFAAATEKAASELASSDCSTAPNTAVVLNR